jgi:beta-barrel assembly-enhancing protease
MKKRNIGLTIWGVMFCLTSVSFAIDEGDILDEIKLGRSVAASISGTTGIYKNKAMTHYLELVGATIVHFNGRNEIPYYFSILNSDSINAFACPGGYVFVTKGLIKAVKNEAELAGVLAHEIAHINYRHVYNQVAPQRTKSVESFLSKWVGAKNISFSVAFNQIASKSLDILFKKGLQHEDEYEADVATIFYIKAAGYNPLSYIEFLKRIQSKKETYSRTHPPLSKRIDLISGFIDSKQDVTGQQLGNRYRAHVQF